MNLDIFHIRTNQKEKQAKEKGAEKWQRKERTKEKKDENIQDQLSCNITYTQTPKRK